jgi:multidrug efflux pump subunit AcrA (membrane-fusion protein)
LLLGALLLSACGALGIGGSATPTPGATPEAASAAAVSAEGRLVPRHYANLSTAASGQVTELLVQEGEQVQAGAVILRLGDREQYQAQIAAAEVELLSAQQVLEELQKNAGLELAQSKQALAEANKVLADYRDEFENLSKPVPQADLERARATVLMAQDRLDKAIDNLAKTEKHYRNKNHILWLFLTKKQFKDLLDNLRTARDMAKDSLYHAQNRYDDLLNHPDKVELAQAQANVTLTQARIAEIQQDIAMFEKGPDPDKVASAEARIKAAQTALAAAQSALKDSEIVAPISGEIADLSIHAGEWVEANQPVVVLADLSQWEIQTDDLTELDVPEVRLGQTVTVRLDALPELELKGVVDAIKGLSEEKRGDVTYTTTILLDQADPRLRWGMTVSVDFIE